MTLTGQWVPVSIVPSGKNLIARYGSSSTVTALMVEAANSTVPSGATAPLNDCGNGFVCHSSETLMASTPSANLPMTSTVTVPWFSPALVFDGGTAFGPPPYDSVISSTRSNVDTLYTTSRTGLVRPSACPAVGAGDGDGAGNGEATGAAVTPAARTTAMIAPA